MKLLPHIFVICNLYFLSYGVTEKEVVKDMITLYATVITQPLSQQNFNYARHALDTNDPKIALKHLLNGASALPETSKSFELHFNYVSAHNAANNYRSPREILKACIPLTTHLLEVDVETCDVKQMVEGLIENIQTLHKSKPK
jgi:hypothetical protein